MDSKNQPLIFVPTYNERENVRPLVEQIQALNIKFDYLFLDDNSPDGTGQELDKLAKEIPNFYVIHRQGKQGIGSAHQVGIRWAYERNYKTLITMDADFTHSPNSIPNLLSLSGEHDVVLGSRYINKDSLAGWNPFRKLLTWIAHILTTALLDLRYDATGAFRVYRLDIIPHDLFDLVISKSYSFFFESLHMINLNEFKIVEVPIHLPPRTYGTSKLSYFEVFRSLRFLIDLWLRTTLHRHKLTAFMANNNASMEITK